MAGGGRERGGHGRGQDGGGAEAESGALPKSQLAAELCRAPAAAPRSGTGATHGAVGPAWPPALQSPEGTST